MSEQRYARLGLGTANLGNLHRAMSDDDAWQILEAAWDRGIRFFDTAPHYGLGLSERRLGAFLSTKPRDEFVVSTKVGRLLLPHDGDPAALDDAQGFVVPADRRRVWDFSSDGIRRSIEGSIERLGIDRVDVAYLHDPERYDMEIAVRDGVPALASLRDEHVVRGVGVASMDTDALSTAVRTRALDTVMVAGRYTLADQSAARELLPECSTSGVDVVAAAVFNSGLLADPAPSTTSLYDYRPVSCDVLRCTQFIATACRESGVELSVAALRFPLEHPGVRGIVVGAASPEHVHRNADALDAHVPDALWRRLRDDGLVAA